MHSCPSLKVTHACLPFCLDGYGAHKRVVPHFGQSFLFFYVIVGSVVHRDLANALFPLVVGD